ncbi:hypothetical protein D9V32_07355 [Mycetocola tolaasinivorans]|uniref:Uncharacterized protein n=1 Tax=Mycetocola tolaasinivorans TaxID=76635 RepID=A0A3L7A6N2_9MICO|nr:hypothetical protein D9V32_07355 [Mycetocola tolaasinivorans]
MTPIDQQALPGVADRGNGGVVTPTRIESLRFPTRPIDQPNAGCAAIAIRAGRKSTHLRGARPGSLVVPCAVEGFVSQR